jgi:hypothetical protein
LVSIEIGIGTTSDNFSSIDWAQGPYFIKTETDPVFTAWDKSTGISIIESQISDLQNYLTVEVDGSITNELQFLSLSNDTLYLSNGGFVKIPSGERQMLSLSNDTIYLTNGGFVKFPASFTGANLLVNYTKTDNVCVQRKWKYQCYG